MKGFVEYENGMICFVLSFIPECSLVVVTERVKCLDSNLLGSFSVGAFHRGFDSYRVKIYLVVCISLSVELQDIDNKVEKV